MRYFGRAEQQHEQQQQHAPASAVGSNAAPDTTMRTSAAPMRALSTSWASDWLDM
jgi:hypothetical protein